ncbi:DUF2917 domain-containing protein [Variovorax sp. LjRoot130]|uniref:DUF2917 domain-containing protein n=1 Tax=Variovorax sp. LjRoot130 TaxID=3342261 RepID=UPI003ED116E5
MLANLDLIDCTEPPNIIVPRGGMICLNNVRGMKLRVMRASVWVTQDAASEDVNLNAGESFCITRSGRTLVNACQYAPLTLVMLEPPVAIEPKLSERLRRLFARMKASRRGCDQGQRGEAGQREHRPQPVRL